MRLRGASPSTHCVPDAPAAELRRSKRPHVLPPRLARRNSPSPPAPHEKRDAAPSRKRGRGQRSEEDESTIAQMKRALKLQAKQLKAVQQLMNSMGCTMGGAASPLALPPPVAAAPLALAAAARPAAARRRVAPRRPRMPAVTSAEALEEAAAAANDDQLAKVRAVRAALTCDEQGVPAAATRPCVAQAAPRSTAADASEAGDADATTDADEAADADVLLSQLDWEWEGVTEDGWDEL